jgi:uncharacterized protein (DUF934 family)
MPRELVIRKRTVERDPWRVFGLTAEALAEPLPEGPVLVPLAYWKEHRGGLVARGDVGVWLAPADEPRDLADDLASVALVAVHFPKFGDGRGYSTAFLLRTRHGYRGELRAFGDIGRDHLFHLARVGFDSYVLPDRYDPHAALASFDELSVRYQGSVDDPVPLFRNRAAATP